MRTGVKLALLIAAAALSSPAAAQEAAPDDAIAARIEEAFVAHRSAAAADAAIEVRDGAVTLTGVTVGESNRAEATAFARAVPGVKSVENRMRIAGTAVAVRSTRLDRMDDAAATVRVKAALLRRGEAFKTNVTTRDGVVVLKGRVASEAERARVVETARRLDGIAAVVDRLTVAP